MSDLKKCKKSHGGEEKSYYAQLSSLINHPLTGTPQAVVIDSLDEVKNINVYGSKIQIKRNGVYLIILAGQVGWQGNNTPVPPSGSYLDLWLVKNGVNVSNSNTRIAIEDIYQTSVLVSQTVTKCQKGDIFEAYINGPSSTIGLVVSPGTYPPGNLPNGEPTSPSIIISIMKI